MTLPSESQDKCPGCKWGFKNKSDYWCTGCYEKMHNISEEDE